MLQFVRLKTSMTRLRGPGRAAPPPGELGELPQRPARPAVRCWMDRLLIVLFLGAIGIPAVVGLAFSEPAVPPSENRNAAPLPSLPNHARGWARLPELIEKYFDDRLGFRRELLQCHAHAKLDWFELSSSPTVAIGLNGWLFLRKPAPFEQPVSRRPSQVEQARRWLSCLLDRQAWLAEHGIRYLVVICPDKESIYPEEYPRSLQSALDEPLLDEFFRQAEGHGLPVIDLRPILREAKSRESLYLKYDTHWNGVAAWYGTAAVLGRLKQWYPQLSVPQRSEYRVATVPFGYGDLARNLTTDNLHEICPSLTRDQASTASQITVDFGPEAAYFLTPNGARGYMTSRAGRPRALFLHDSFGELMRDHLSEEFDHLYCFPSLVLPTNFVEREKPDLVIQELIERKLKTPPERILLPNRPD